MKTISVRDLQKQIKNCIDISQSDRVVITRQGKPAAVLLGVENLNWETLVLGLDKDFWHLIQKRRKQRTIPLEKLKKRLKD